MSLLKCPECGKFVSSTTEQCIHCGYRFKKDDEQVLPYKSKDSKITLIHSGEEPDNPWLLPIVFIVFGLILFGLWFLLFSIDLGIVFNIVWFSFSALIFCVGIYLLCNEIATWKTCAYAPNVVCYYNCNDDCIVFLFRKETIRIPRDNVKSIYNYWETTFIVYTDLNNKEIRRKLCYSTNLTKVNDFLNHEYDYTPEKYFE